MADVITTLHPEGAPEDNLYPNVKDENIPSSIERKGVSLWENANPSSTFGSGSITVSDMSSFNRIRIKFKYVHDSDATFYQEFGIDSGAHRVSVVQHDYAGGAHNVITRVRDFFINSNTNIYFDNSVVQGDTSASWIVPIAVYGIK